MGNVIMWSACWAAHVPSPPSRCSWRPVYTVPKKKYIYISLRRWCCIYKIETSCFFFSLPASPQNPSPAMVPPDRGPWLPVRVLGKDGARPAPAGAAAGTPGDEPRPCGSPWEAPPPYPLPSASSPALVQGTYPRSFIIRGFLSQTYQVCVVVMRLDDVGLSRRETGGGLDQVGPEELNIKL